MTSTISISDLRVGDKIWKHGFLYQVKFINYDTQGNSLDVRKPAPRYVVTADAVNHDPKHLPYVYARDMTFGIRYDDTVVIEVNRS